jgi:hypothetical protein
MQQKAVHKTPEQIEYETVTMKIPTKLMNWLRSLEKTTGETAQEQLQYQVIDSFRASIEAITGEELIEVFQLGPIFRELLKDERFKDC